MKAYRKIKQKINSFKEWTTFGYALAIGCVIGIMLVTLVSLII